MEVDNYFFLLFIYLKLIRLIYRKIVTAINQQIGEAELIIYLDRQNIDRLFKEINQCTAIKKLLENNFNGPVYAIHNFLSTLRKTSGQFVITGALEGYLK